MVWRIMVSLTFHAKQAVESPDVGGVFDVLTAATEQRRCRSVARRMATFILLELHDARLDGFEVCRRLKLPSATHSFRS